MKAVYLPETLTWKESPKSGGDVILSSVTPINTYVIHLVLDGTKIEFVKLECLDGIGSFKMQRFQTIDEAKSAAQRHYDFIFSIALERYSEFLIDVSEVVLIRPDLDGEKIEIMRGVEAISCRRTNLAHTWRLSCKLRWFSKSTGEFNSDANFLPDDDVDFATFEEAKAACENWVKVNL